MSRVLRHLGAVLITVAVVCAIGIALNHFFAGSGVDHRVRFRRFPPKGLPPKFKSGGPGHIFVGPQNGGGSVDVHNLLNTLTLLALGIAVVASLATLARRSRRSRRPA
jgi:hypothetical protein